MDTWINEGLSAAAEWVVSGAHDTSSSGRLAWYNSDQTGLIKYGNNFFVWDNRRPGTDPNSHVNAVMDDYATVNLFFHWIRLQSGGNASFYREISESTYRDYRAVLNAMTDYIDWGSLMKTWHAANYIMAPSGPYGYMNDAVLKNIQAKTVPVGTYSLGLYIGRWTWHAGSGIR